MLEKILQGICEVPYMDPNQTMKFYDWYRKIYPPMRIAADFECMKTPVATKSEKNILLEKLFVKKPLAIGFNKF